MTNEELQRIEKEIIRSYGEIRLSIFKISLDYLLALTYEKGSIAQKMKKHARVIRQVKIFREEESKKHYDASDFDDFLASLPKEPLHRDFENKLIESNLSRREIKRQFISHMRLYHPEVTRTMCKEHFKLFMFGVEKR